MDLFNANILYFQILKYKTNIPDVIRSKKKYYIIHFIFILLTFKLKKYIDII